MSEAQVWLARGQKLMDAGWEEEARVALTRALSLDPALRVAYQSLAMLYDPLTGPTPEQWEQLMRGEVPERIRRVPKEDSLSIDELLQEDQGPHHDR